MRQRDVDRLAKACRQASPAEQIVSWAILTAAVALLVFGIIWRWVW